MRLLRRTDERGFTLIEVMLVCSLFLVVLGATLTAFTAFTTNHRRGREQQDQAEEARVGLDVAARQLRNLANPTVNGVDDDRPRARPMTSSSRPRIPPRPGCATARRRRAAVAQRRAPVGGGELDRHAQHRHARLLPGNRLGDRSHRRRPRSPTRPEASTARYSNTSAVRRQPASCPASAAEYSRITNVGIELFVDDKVGDSLREMRVSTAVFLRNQNEPPTAARHFDPEGDEDRSSSTARPRPTPRVARCEFFWFTGTAPTAADFADCTAAPANAAGTGVTYTHTFTEAVGATVNLWLVVRDPGCLTNTYPISVVVPS